MRPGRFICASQESAAPTMTADSQLRKVKRRPIAPLRSLPRPIISKSERAFLSGPLNCDTPQKWHTQYWVYALTRLLSYGAAMPYRLTGEAFFLRPIGRHEARRLRADLPRTQWSLSLSCVTEWRRDHQDDQRPESQEQLAWQGLEELEGPRFPHNNKVARSFPRARGN